MDEKVKEQQDVLLVKTKQDDKLKVVSGMDEKGELKTVPPRKEHEKDFMKIDKHSNVLENFFSNFLRQYKDPTHFNFFRVAAENVESNATVIGEMLKEPEKQSNKEMLDSVPITIKVGDAVLCTDVRLSLKETPDGRIVPAIHAIQREPQLEKQFFGNTFTEADKKALIETGNLGRLIELKIPNVATPVVAFVSVDKLTNDLVALSADKIRVPNEIKG